ncbi:MULTISPECIES: hypothetical protein [Streptomyces]|uniref:hypothetical protein n=1 Tax=Streptomyces TaxID=1883 RepID=UPI0006998717|nr:MULTISPECIES: hypothetical protein [Streptomyces]MYU56704.1 hypothetical protein [Streptomyces sp. SID7805]
MTHTITRAITVLGSEVRINDIIEVGGNLHRIVDVRAIHGTRRRLQFADGNAYILGCSMRIGITRAFAAEHGGLNAPRLRPRLHTGGRAC